MTVKIQLGSMLSKLQLFFEDTESTTQTLDHVRWYCFKGVDWAVGKPVGLGIGRIGPYRAAILSFDHMTCVHKDTVAKYGVGCHAHCHIPAIYYAITLKQLIVYITAS